MRAKRLVVSTLAASLLAGLAATAGQGAISSVSGQVTLISPPASVQLGALTSDAHMFAFNERQCVALPSALTLNISTPGTYTGGSSLSPVTIPAGTLVSSQFVHSNPVHPPQHFNATVVTDRDILGIAIKQPRLDASDFLGAPGTSYPTGLAPRGLELQTQGDSITLGADHRTVTLNVTTQRHLDQIRIITACPPSLIPCTSASIQSNFNGTLIPTGDFIWFNSVIRPTGLPTSQPVTFTFTNQTISFSANGKSFNLHPPDATLTFSPTATLATTSFSSGKWQTTVPSSGLAGNVFLSGLPFQVPSGFPAGINPVTWSGTLSTDTPGTGFSWKWAAAAYSSFSTNPAALGVKPVDDNSASSFKNSDHAGTPENFKSSVVGGARGGGGSNFTGSLSGTGSGTCPS